ncbi:related to Beclin 1 [Melanopsichium pennsylvanicum]|uniref:Related to Beclin 1 n=2 Tax=Melanopsichium pennsylvanicum TaxID=63383 RepID=A0AAJ4XSA6_9BASI|nr:related to Beclin 1 [Melanopsichium pennsylvanicum 4]SNX86168.1 related to Beclin 1 [Melanopsichium pennsylvanicum]
MSWSCQRCRQPLLLHPSVSSDLDLNQSAYDLIQDSFIAPRHAFTSSKFSSSPSKAPLQTRNDAASTSKTTAETTSDVNSLSARLAASSALFDLLSHPPPSRTDKSSSSASRSSKKTLNLCKTASTSTVIDHPLCKACTDTLLDIMDGQMSEVRAQRHSYLAFEDELRRYNVLPPSSRQQRRSSSSSSSVNTQQEDESGVSAAAHQAQMAEECDRLQKEISQLLADESSALSELESAEAARLSVEAELAAIAEEEAALEQEEERFWSSYSYHSLALCKLEEERASLAMALTHDKNLLTRLQSTNVYTDAFCIGHSGGIATINGLKLGRLPGQPVEWNEINAAWGQTALLLDVLARKLGIAFKGYRLIPKGSFSVVYRYENSKSQHASSASTCSNSNSSFLPAPSQSAVNESHADVKAQEGGAEDESGKNAEKAVYELYGSSEWQIGRLLQSRRFDHAQTGFLACLKQVLDKAEREDQGGFRAPHGINKDKIGEASIRLQFGSDETWTRALRHVLVSCNRLLLWMIEREKKGCKGGDGTGVDAGGRVTMNGRHVSLRQA